MKTKLDTATSRSEDRIRQATREGRTLFCAWLTINSALLLHSIGEAGWDCVLIDQQHGLGGHDAMVECLTAAKATGMAALVLGAHVLAAVRD
jgi:4-hydroxy-2-oxoheptanedioate aldolase